MNNILDTQLIIHSDCKLTSICHTDFNHINPDINDKYISVEFLKYKDKCLYDSCIIKTSQINSSSEFALLNDGVYEYNCYIIQCVIFRKDFTYGRFLFNCDNLRNRHTERFQKKLQPKAERRGIHLCDDHGTHRLSFLCCQRWL